MWKLRKEFTPADANFDNRMREQVAEVVFRYDGLRSYTEKKFDTYQINMTIHNEDPKIDRYLGLHCLTISLKVSKVKNGKFEKTLYDVEYDAISKKYFSRKNYKDVQQYIDQIVLGLKLAEKG